jgi:hypothetical protein
MRDIPVTFSVEIDGRGVSHVTYRSTFTRSGPERVGGRFLPQYHGRRHDMDILAQELQVAYDKEAAP